MAAYEPQVAQAGDGSEALALRSGAFDLARTASEAWGRAVRESAAVDYELRLAGDRYQLNAGGRKVLEGPLKNYSSFGFPYDQRSFLFYGDDTGSAAADMELSGLRVEYGPPAGAVGIAAD